MKDEINCRYCSQKMVLRTLGTCKKKVSFYECPDCLSRSPIANNEIMANTLARIDSNVVGVRDFLNINANSIVGVCFINACDSDNGQYQIKMWTTTENGDAVFKRICFKSYNEADNYWHSLQMLNENN